MFKAPHGRLQGTEAPVSSVVLPVVWDTSGLGSLEHPRSQLESGRHGGFGRVMALDSMVSFCTRKKGRITFIKHREDLDNLKLLDCQITKDEIASGQEMVRAKKC